MGAYLSTPVREKIAEDKEADLVNYGASSMQGWRISQEDAHNCCAEFDAKTVLFAVYDGHGGEEVAKYTAMHYPGFLKQNERYQSGQLQQALEDTFMEFDATLVQEEVVAQLREIAGVDPDERDPLEEGAEEGQEVALLCEEATLPIEELKQRYGAVDKAMAQLKNFNKEDNFLSPALRAKSDAQNKNNAQDNCQVENGDDKIKLKLESVLVNGETDNNNVDSVDSKTKTKEEVINGNCVSKVKSECDSTVSDEPSETKDQEEITSTKGKGSKSKKGKGKSTKSEPIDSSGAGDAPLSNKNTDKEAENSSVVSSQGDADSGLGCAGESDAVSSSVGGSGSVSDAPGGSVSESAGGSEVSSSAGGSGSTAGAGAGSEVATSAGGSGSSSSAGGSGSGSSSAGGSSSSGPSEDPGGPSSSTGRKRSGKKNIIPEEGEDESSFDEEEETTDEDSDSDEDEWVDDDSEDDDEEGEEGLGGMMPPDSEEEGDEEGDDEVMGGGEEPGMDSGCTAVVALLRERELYVANAGDSRCVLCRDGKAVEMSEDHKPEDEIESNRITKAGGKVTMDGRVNGGLNLSRAIGDHCYKKNTELPAKEQMITALPDIRSVTLEDKDEFMVLACDGIWNVMSSQDVVNFVRERLQAGCTKLSSICDEMFDYCLAPDTMGDGTGCDNMTCIIVTFDKLLKAIPASNKRKAESDQPVTDSGEEAASKKAKIDSEKSQEAPKTDETSEESTAT